MSRPGLYCFNKKSDINMNLGSNVFKKLRTDKKNIGKKTFR